MEIVDASAALVAAFVPGIKSVWGVGAGTITVPDVEGGIWADKLIQSFDGNVREPFTHVSDMPDAPKIINSSATVTEIQWRIPMRLYVDRNDQGNARRVCVPFYAAYLSAFAANAMILGTCNSAEIGSMDLFHDKDGTGFVGIAMILLAWERLDFEFDVGITPFAL